VQNVFLPTVLLFVTGAFLVLFFRKTQFHTVAGDAAVVFGLLAAVGTVLSLHPDVQVRLQQWNRQRIEERERRFWQGRDAQDIRQAEAQAQAAAERAERRRLKEQQAAGGGGS
jgi:hypothetical protein